MVAFLFVNPGEARLRKPAALELHMRPHSFVKNL